MNYLNQILNTSKPDLLYHYTSQTGLLGIINEEELWATKVHYLNDSKEFKLALGLILSEIDKRLVSADSDTTDRLNILKDDISDISSVHVFVLSFTTKGDLLSQWRAYGADGSGYSIGFDSKSIIDIAIKHGCIFAPCVYEMKKQNEIVKEIVDVGLSDQSRILNNNNIPATEFSDFVAMVAPLLKDHSFIEEQEWRLISPMIASTRPNFSFKAGKTSLIPYYRFPLSESSTNKGIKEIIIGPSPHQELASDALKALLYSKKLNKKSEVKCSDIPYRSW
jgi:hypothetical protein